jgi:hypothetical protein
MKKPVQICMNGLCLAEWTGLEPATPGVTGRYSNRLNYHSSLYTLACERRLCLCKLRCFTAKATLMFGVP